MNQQQREKFTRDTRALAHKLFDRYDRGATTSVEGVESLSTELIQGLIASHNENSTQYTIKIKDKINLWFHKGLSQRK